MKTIVILNEQHTLLESQKSILEDKFKNYEILPVPANGWTKEQQIDMCNSILEKTENEKVNVVFASPVPVLLAKISKHIGMRNYRNMVEEIPLNLCGFIFHNDLREKKELPNGKIIFTVATEGWELVEI